MVVMDFYLEPLFMITSSSLTFDLVVMLRAYLNGAFGFHTSM